jgi:hypothetical protein
LKTAIPQLGLHPSDEGHGCSVWFSPARTYEVEFDQPDLGPTRALVFEEQLEVSQHLHPGA